MSYTYDKIGTKKAWANNTGNELTKVSAVFGAAASGDKLPLFCLIPRITPIRVILVIN